MMDIWILLFTGLKFALNGARQENKQNYFICGKVLYSSTNVWDKQNNMMIYAVGKNSLHGLEF